MVAGGGGDVVAGGAGVGVGDEARRVAEEVLEELGPYCVRCVIAGGIRRGKPNPHDVEICYIPVMVAGQVDLLTEGEVPATGERIEELRRRGWWDYDQVVKRNGPKYKRLVRDGVVVELFRAVSGNWGLVLAIRTGPVEFNRLAVLERVRGGGMPWNMMMKGGWLWRQGRKVETRTERVYFEELELPYWGPQRREADRLRTWLRKAERLGR